MFRSKNTSSESLQQWPKAVVVAAARSAQSSGARLVDWTKRNRIEIITFFICVALYYVVIARRFFGSEVVIGGDTQLLWSQHFFVLESLVEYLQYPLWDPTTLGGYPAHLLMVNGYFQNFHPFHVPFFIVATALGRLFHVDTNILMVFHKTIYIFSLNLVAVMLISREICVSRLARLLPPVIYSLCAFQFYALRDNMMVEGLPPALFFTFALFYHANRRTAHSLLVLIMFLTLYVFGFCYAYLLSSIWWVATLTILVLLTSPGLIPDSYRCVRQMWGEKLLRIHLLLAVAFFLITCGAVGFSLMGTIGEVLRAPGNQPVSYDVSSGGSFGARAIYGVQIWTNFLVWAPFPEIHQNFFKYDPWEAGIHHRYLGMVLLPLLVVAAMFGHQRRFLWPLLITTLIATAYISYGAENPFLAFLLDNFPPVRNTRAMANLLPRDVGVLLILGAGIGLDVLVSQAPRAGDTRIWVTTRTILLMLMVGAVVLVVAVAVPALMPIRHAVAHMGVYLGLSCLVILVLAHGAGQSARVPLVLVLLVTAVMDLSISAAAYSKLNHTWSPYGPPQNISMPSPRLGPKAPDDPPWVGTYRGEFHRLFGGPYVGTRTWLVLATHPSWQPALLNWDTAGRDMLAYPDFRFFTNATYIPFEAIRTIDNVKLPASVITPPTLLVKEGDREIIKLPGRDVVVEDGMAGFMEGASTAGERAAAFSGWALESSGRPARTVLIFVGDTLWGSFATGGFKRPDLAGFGKDAVNAGFNGLLEGVAKDDQKNIRGFVVLADGKARELKYSAGYPFTRGEGPGPESLRARPAKDGPPTFYVHDQKAELANIVGREEKLTWSVAEWTPNHYTVRVSAPSDGYILNLENYNRYWKAYVDGVSVDILRANFTMQAIKLTKGDHLVSWRYMPLPFELGWVLFYLAFAGAWVAFRYSSASLVSPPNAAAARR